MNPLRDRDYAIDQSQMLLEQEKGAFVRGLSKEIDGSLALHARIMSLDWGSYNPTDRRYYEGPKMHLCKDS